MKATRPSGLFPRPREPAKPLAARRDESPAPAPNLSPDMSQLVILPLPLRSREYVYGKLKCSRVGNLEYETNACFRYLDPDSAMQLLSCEFAANNGNRVMEIWEACFGDKGDKRTGFFTLIAAANYNPNAYTLNEKFEKNPSDPLVRYLWEMHDDNIHSWQARFGFGPGRHDAETFLGKLTTFRRIASRWQGNYINSRLWGQRDTERERAIQFAKRNADNVLGWCTLAMVEDRCPNPAAWKSVADGWKVLAEKSALRYPARYEEARCLGNAQLNEEAQQKYQNLFADALKQGILPPLDSSFRNVLEGGKEDIWAKLMRDTAKKCAEKKRPVIVDVRLAVLSTRRYGHVGHSARPGTIEAAVGGEAIHDHCGDSFPERHESLRSGRCTRSQFVERSEAGEVGGPLAAGVADGRSAERQSAEHRVS